MNGEIFYKAVESVTDPWRKQRKKEERGRPEVKARRKTVMRSAEYEYSTRVTVKEAAWECMEDAYMKASSGKGFAAARQVMYAARKYILEHAHDRHGEPLPFNDDYFTQTLIPDYIKEHASAADWDVTYDARGHLAEPHTKKTVPLGTLDVRRYLRSATRHDGDLTIPEIDDAYPTCGPKNRFVAVLFIEKEGFLPLFEAVALASRYDIAIMTTKGQTPTAARKLAETVCSYYGVPLYVLRDFDKAGFEIAASFRKDTRRYEFSQSFEVVDLGLRLEDALKWELPSEDVYYTSNPTASLHENGATPEEIAFLCEGGSGKHYYGRRVELNAFTNDMLVEWIEDKLQEYGVKKIVPDDDVLNNAYDRAYKVAIVNKAIDDALMGTEETEHAPPPDLKQQIEDTLKAHPEKPWDKALADVARADFEENE